MKESENPKSSSKTTYLVVGVVAAAVSAATVAYIFWRRSNISAQAESVQQLIDRCHDQIYSIERRLGELNSANHQTQAASAS
jgi:flagellar basal body-associated protein FliL